MKCCESAPGAKTLLTNIRLGKKNLSRTNALAYFAGDEEKKVFFYFATRPKFIGRTAGNGNSKVTLLKI